MDGIEDPLIRLIDLYIDLEKKLQTIIHPFNRHFCVTCVEKCCKEEFCRESIESEFLSKLIEKQKILYDNHNGWMSPSGCRLEYGRPLVCYDFFCDDISSSTSFKTASIQTLINEFVATGNRARGNTHLICIENLDRFSSRKIEKMCHRLRTISTQIVRLKRLKDG